MTWRVLTPPGSGAVAVLAWDGQAPGPDLWTHGNQALGQLEPDRFARARVRVRGRVLDDILALGTPWGLELHVHGGPAIIRAIVGEPHREVVDAPRSLREARARISRERGPLADLERRARESLARGYLTADLRRDLDRCLARAPLAACLARPPVVRIVGRPNAGKSTLFNALLRSQRALTSPVAGTTRDTVRALFRLEGAPMVLEDTAGSPTPEAGAAADLVVHLLAVDEPAGSLPGALEVRGKADLRPPGREVGVSGRTGRGVPELARVIAARLGLAGGPAEDVEACLDGELAAVLERAARLPSA